MSPELHLMMAPRRTYARLCDEGRRVSWAGALRRPALVALVLGCTAAISSTGHVTAGLVLTTTLGWSFVVVLQMAIAVSFLAGPAGRGPGLPTAVDYFFAAHGPWSLWMLGFAACAVAAPAMGQSTLEATAIVPAVWTLWIVHAFHRTVLRLDRRGAVRRTMAHQAVTWAMVFAFFSFAVQLWPRIVQVIGR